MRYLRQGWLWTGAAVAAVASAAIAWALPCGSSSDAPFVVGALAIVLGTVAAVLAVRARAGTAAAVGAGAAVIAIIGYVEFYLVIGSFLFHCGD